MADALTDFEIVSLLNMDNYGQLYRGRPFSEEKPGEKRSSSLIIRLENQEVLIRQWTHPRLFSEDCRKRLELYFRIQKQSDYLARIVAGDVSAGRWVFEPFVCTLADHALYIETNSFLWKRVWHDACSGLAFLHNNYLPHGRMNSSELFFTSAGTLKIGGVFPWITDENDFLSDLKGLKKKSFSSSSLFREEFKRDINNLCRIFLAPEIAQALPKEDLVDIKNLATGKVSLAQANEQVRIRFNDFQKAYQTQEQQRAEQATYIKAISAKRPRKGRGVLFSLGGLAVVIAVLTGGKILIDDWVAPPKKPNSSAQYQSGKKINQKEFQWSLDEQMKRDRMVSVSEQNEGKEKQKSADLLAPPIIEEKPEIDVFVGKITSVRYQEIKVFNANLQKTLTIIVDEDSQLSFADGTPIKLELLTPGKELEVQYEKENDSSVKVYASSIKVREL